MITENKINSIKPADKREIEARLIANVLSSVASLLEVTGWINCITTDIHGLRTKELDLPAALWQVVHDNYGSREGLWHATREALLAEIGQGRVCLAKWNDKQKDASDVIALCRRTVHNLKTISELRMEVV